MCRLWVKKQNVEVGPRKLARMASSTQLEAFHAALRNGDHEAVDQLLTQNPGLADVVVPNQRSALHLAAAHGHENVVARLLAHCPKLLYSVSAHGSTALHYAASRGHDKVMDLLLLSISELDNVYNIDPGERKVDVRLLAANTNLTEAIGNSKNALHCAVKHGHAKVVAQLLAHSPSLIDTRTADGRTSLHVAATYGHDKIVAQLLAQKKEIAATKNHLGATALHIAAEKGHEKVVEQLCAHSPELICLEDRIGWSALHYAAGEGHEKILEILLAANPDVIHSTDTSGNTVLHRVLGFREPEHVLFSEALMERVWRMDLAALHAVNLDIWTPYNIAIQSNNTWALETMRDKLFSDEILRFPPNSHTDAAQSLLDMQCECLVVLLNRDVISTVYAYLGFDYRKRSKLSLSPITPPPPPRFLTVLPTALALPPPPPPRTLAGSLVEELRKLRTH